MILVVRFVFQIDAVFQHFGIVLFQHENAGDVAAGHEAPLARLQHSPLEVADGVRIKVDKNSVVKDFSAAQQQ